MPEFVAGEQKTAIAPMTNPTTKAFDYSVELYMGTDLAIMVKKDFHLEANESKDISLPVTMPILSGVYPVYIGIFSGGQFIEPIYRGEDVVIVPSAPSGGDFVYSEQVCSERPFPPAPVWTQPVYSVRITNQGAVEGTRVITLHIRTSEDGVNWSAWQGSWIQTLDSGQSVIVNSNALWPMDWPDKEFSGVPVAYGPYSTARIHVEDDAGGSTPECSI